MAKFSDIAQGAFARRSLTFMLPSGVSCTVDLGLVLGDAEAAILRDARAFAMERGVLDPKNGDPLYELGVWVHTIARGVLDPESPPDAPRPFFDGGVAQILDERTGLGREWISLLFEAQQAWQDELAPRPKEMGAQEYFLSLLQIAEAPPKAELPFFRWRRVLQDSFLRTCCGMLVGRHLSKLQPTAPSSDDSTNSATSAPPSTSPPATPADKP